MLSGGGPLLGSGTFGVALGLQAATSSFTKFTNLVEPLNTSTQQPRTRAVPPHPLLPLEPQRQKGLDEVARRTLLSLVTTSQLYLDRGVVGAGVNKGQAHLHRFVAV